VKEEKPASSIAVVCALVFCACDGGDPRPPADTASTEATASAVPSPPAPSAALPSSSAVASVSASAEPPPRRIATWMIEASEKLYDWRYKRFTVEGVYRRTSLTMSGSYIGGEHPGQRALVLHVADSLEAPDAEQLECSTALLAAPTDLRAGDRIRVEGEVQHRVIAGPRQYHPYLLGCTYTRL
jgi:hypothetical protein